MTKRGRRKREPTWWEVVKLEALWFTGASNTEMRAALKIGYRTLERWIDELKLRTRRLNV